MYTFAQIKPYCNNQEIDKLCKMCVKSNYTKIVTSKKIISTKGFNKFILTYRALTNQFLFLVNTI